VNASTGIALALAALVAGAAAPLRAQGLASPGPLAAPHARLDDLTKCLSCHETGRQLSGRKCLDCHVSLARRIRTGLGYHAGATRGGTQLACASCHSEHNGRPYRLVRWPNNVPKEQFNHRDAGWNLEGAHARHRCESCHRAELIADAAVRGDRSLSAQRTYLGLGSQCVACHLDEHRGRVSRTCEDCHTTTEWKPAPRFDHARTRFELTGRHRDVPCSGCHQERRADATGPGGTRDTSYVDFGAGRSASTGCAGCHRSPHRETSRVGRCERCHTVEGWFVLPDSMRHFDHAPLGFPLRGAHARARCESCHLSSAASPLPRGVQLVRANFQRPFARQKIGFARCGQCHTDVHQGELAPRRDCDACHDETAFTPTHFTQAMHDSTAFALTGAHAATPCNACHPALPGAAAHSGALRFRWADSRCAACHRDPHGRQFAPEPCESCHGTEAWNRLTFDHDRTRYPLRGAHVRLACSRCHTRPTDDPRGAVRFRGLPTSCEAAECHGDPHRGQFADRGRGGACISCHSEAMWRPAQFDHQRDSDYPLDGAHQNVPCAGCHRPEGTPPVARFRPLPHRCEDCHRTGTDRRRRP